MTSSGVIRIRNHISQEPVSSRLNVCSQTNPATLDPIKNLNWTVGPYNERAFNPLHAIVVSVSPLDQVIYMSIVWFRLCTGTSKSDYEWKGDTWLPLARPGFEPRVSQEPVFSLLNARSPIELSMIKLRAWTWHPPLDERVFSAQLMPLLELDRPWLWRYTYLLSSLDYARRSDFEWKGGKFSSSDTSVTFLFYLVKGRVCLNIINTIGVLK